MKKQTIKSLKAELKEVNQTLDLIRACYPFQFNPTTVTFSEQADKADGKLKRNL